MLNLVIFKTFTGEILLRGCTISVAQNEQLPKPEESMYLGLGEIFEFKIKTRPLVFGEEI